MQMILSRRSIRSFTEKQPEHQAIEQILRAAMRAPSAGDQQPWEFIAITNKPLLEELSGISANAFPLKKAPLAILILGNRKYLKYPQYWQQDLAACCENIYIACSGLGLGTVWLGCAPEEDRMKNIRRILQLNEDKLPFAIMPIGYAKRRKPALDTYQPTRVEWRT